MFASLLIANRGEIACRIMRTARSMGIRTIAVYSDADRNARHVREADEAWHLGGAAAADSYLKVDRLLDVAVQARVEAIHPGYGFLSENADFAEQVAAAGLVWVGPPSSAIRAMGSKSKAKTIMEKASVPLVPGYHGDEQGVDFLASEADKIGYPVLIKASAGGGGKGMRVVETAADFQAALDGARREATASFGDDHVLIEKYLTKPRHVEIQVFCDSHGGAVHLFERDCSVQRRHQKVLEEAPAPGMTEERRAEMGAAAVAAARAIGYEGAGTVEFIAEGDDFFFMEMNTRLQVEHPVTELITNTDLVEWQLKVAAGQALPQQQDELSIDGHAFEARLYAEDPERDFLPATGTLRRLYLAEDLPGVRIDTGVDEGDEVSVYYDPMIAKVIAHGRDRTEALRRLHAALEATEVAGVATNRAFLSRLSAHKAFAAGDVDTRFIEAYGQDLLIASAGLPDVALVLAAVAELQREEQAVVEQAANGNDPWSPWASSKGWRLNAETTRDILLKCGDQSYEAEVHFTGEGPEVLIGETRYRVDIVSCADDSLVVELNGKRVSCGLSWSGNQLELMMRNASYPLIFEDIFAGQGDDDASGGRLTAPMPGKVVTVKVASGEEVKAGQALMVLEAMKMEHTISAPADGVVTLVHYGEGDQVEDGADLIAFQAA